jgi:hypothetical protein
MSQPDHLDIEGNHPGMRGHRLSCLGLIISRTVMVDGHPEPTQSALNQLSQPPQGESNFGDGSGPLFSIYSKIAEEEDNRMVDRWQKDADGTLVFVSLCFNILNTTHINWNTVDWSILRRSHHITRCVRTGPQAKFSGYLSILSCEYLSDSRRPKRHRTTHIHPFPRRHTYPILSSEICRLGELALVLELSYESYLRAIGNFLTPMGTSICQAHSASTVQPREASENACILRWWRG